MQEVINELQKAAYLIRWAISQLVLDTTGDLISTPSFVMTAISYWNLQKQINISITCKKQCKTLKFARFFDKKTKIDKKNLRKRNN